MFLHRIQRFFNQNTHLAREESETQTYQEIADGVNFSGYNLWILGFAMVVACIGLNTDSISAIIGAMLISPLMGPIVGYSFALAIHDRELKNNAIRNWIWMTLISLLASTLFFLISPFDNDTAILLSFTKASIFDILIAFFGGMAGFIGIIKREGVKVMAGVAVATACMPPLCTAGFGLAHGNWMEFAGGLYFYSINCLFIGLATFLLTRFTGFHLHFKNKTTTHKTAPWLWTLFIVSMIIPGTYIAWQKWNEEKYPLKEKSISDEQRIINLEKKVQQLDSILHQK
jgi:uncharacterized hydrophobic protein (TIGR00271 family)